MKVLLVSDAFPPSFGGVERHAYILSNYLKSQKVDVTVLTESTDNDDRAFFDSGSKILRDLHFAKRNLSLEWVYTYIKNSKMVKDEINRIGDDFDVVHYHGTHMIYFDKINMDAPFLSTIHGIFPSCISHWGVNNWCGKKLSSINCAICTIKIRKYYLPLFPAMVLYNKYYYNNMIKSLKSIDCIVGVSNYVRDIVRESFQLTNIRTIYNFIDIKNDILKNLSLKTQSDVNIDESKKIILFSGRLDPEKGILLLLEKFKDIKEKEKDAVLVISGIGTLGKHVEKMSSENKDIVYVGYLSRDVQIKLLNNSSLFIAPSMYPDACPTSILEAMSLGVPVIGSNLGGIPELIVDGETGYIVDINKPDEITTRALEVLIEGKSSFKEKCIAQAEKFDISNVGLKIIKLYNELL